MIELFKILKGIYDPLCIPQFDLVQISEDTIRTRGNTYKLIQHHCYYDLVPGTAAVRRRRQSMKHPVESSQ